MGIMAELKRNHVYLGDALAVAKERVSKNGNKPVTISMFGDE
jgi:hypothetical protein